MRTCGWKLYTTVYTLNRLRTLTLRNESPFQNFFLKEPDYDFFRVFGCECFRNVIVKLLVAMLFFHENCFLYSKLIGKHTVTITPSKELDPNRLCDSPKITAPTVLPVKPSPIVFAPGHQSGVPTSPCMPISVS